MLPPCYSKINYWKFFDVDFTGQLVLDIGSSIGSFKKSMRFKNSLNSTDKTRSYVTLDINPNAKAKIIGDAHQLPFPDNFFDIVIVNNIIEHCRNTQKAVFEFRRVLKDGGAIYYTIPFIYPIHEAPNDYVRYTEYGLRELFKDFKDMTVYPRGGWFSTMTNFIFQITHALDKILIGPIIRILLYIPLWIFVQLDRLDNSQAFTQVYFGKLTK